MTELVVPEPYSEQYSLTGEVIARDVTLYSFPGSGKIIDVFVDVGDAVNVGDKLAVLDATALSAVEAAAKAGVVSAQAQLELATVQFERQNSLMRQGFTTRAALEDASTVLSTANGTLTSAKAELDRAKDSLSRTSLLVSQAGVITKRFADPGEIVQSTQPVIEVATSVERDAQFAVPEAMFLKQISDQPVQLHLLSNVSVTATGTVTEISPSVNPLDGTVDVRVRVNQPQGNMPIGTAVLGTAYTQPQPMYRLPWRALDKAGETPVVWIVNESTGIIEQRTVVVKNYERGSVIISEGLLPGDRVVTTGIQFLKSGEVIALETNQESK